MEENFRPAASPAMTEFLANELTRSNSDASSLTTDNSEDILHQSSDNHTTWTNEKHNLYLDHLEVSFVKQLQQSMGLLASCSEENKSEKRLSQKRHGYVDIASDQGYCWQKTNYGRGQPFLHTSADTRDALKNPRVQWCGCVCNNCPPASADLQECLVLRSTEKHIAVEVIKSQGLKTCSRHPPASNIYTGDIFDFTIGDFNSTSVHDLFLYLIVPKFWEGDRV